MLNTNISFFLRSHYTEQTFSDKDKFVNCSWRTMANNDKLSRRKVEEVIRKLVISDSLNVKNIGSSYNEPWLLFHICFTLSNSCIFRNVKAFYRLPYGIVFLSRLSKAVRWFIVVVFIFIILSQLDIYLLAIIPNLIIVILMFSLKGTRNLVTRFEI